LIIRKEKIYIIALKKVIKIKKKKKGKKGQRKKKRRKNNGTKKNKIMSLRHTICGKSKLCAGGC